MILANEKRFMSHMFEGETMLRESLITWSTLTPFVPTEFVKKVTRIYADHNDGLFGFHRLEKESNDGF